MLDFCHYYAYSNIYLICYNMLNTDREKNVRLLMY